MAGAAVSPGGVEGAVDVLLVPVVSAMPAWLVDVALEAVLDACAGWEAVLDVVVDACGVVRLSLVEVAGSPVVCAPLVPVVVVGGD